MPAFVDTNLLVYARDASEPEKQPLAMEWLEALWESREGRLSVQVLEEYYVTVTGKLSPGLEPEVARDDVRDLSLWRPLPLDASLLREAWSVEDRHGFSFWDALILAASRRADCTHLLTEDLQDGQEVDGVRVVNPFRHRPDTIL